jgi:hypothetical protein
MRYPTLFPLSFINIDLTATSPSRAAFQMALKRRPHALQIAFTRVQHIRQFVVVIASQSSGLQF